MILLVQHASPETKMTLFGNTAHRAITALRLSFALTLLAIVTAAQPYTVTTIAGGQMPATAAYSGSLIVIPALSGLAADSAGNIYFSSGNQFLGGSNVVFKLDSAGTLTRVAGNGIAGFSDDGGRATAAELNGPGSLAVDNAGNLYILDGNNIRVRKVAPNGLISTVAGNGVPLGNPFGYNSGDGGPAINAQLGGPTGISVDGRGNLYINTVRGLRKVTTDGLISTIHAALPGGWFCTDSAGNLYYVESLSTLVKEGPNGATLISAATGVQMPAVGLAADGSGNAYLTFGGTFPSVVNKIVMVTSTGIVKTLAGGDSIGDSGDGGPATGATLYYPNLIAADATGNVYFIDGIPRIRMVSRQGTLTTLATGIGDGGLAAFATLGSPGNISRDTAGNLFFVDGNRVRKIDAQGNISTFAGTGVGAEPIDGKPASQTTLSSPQAVLADALGNVYITDSYGLHKVDAHGILTTIAPQPSTDFIGSSLAIDNNNTIYVAGVNCVRKVNPDGSTSPVTACAPIGTSVTYSGDGGPAILAHLVGNLNGMITDSAGNLYVSDSNNNRVRKISASGIITTVAGNGTGGYSGDGGLATNSQLNFPRSLALDTGGNLFIADSGNYVVRKVTPNGIITTVAGNGTLVAGTASGPATAASIVPWGLTSDGAGGLYVTDNRHGRVMQLTSSVHPALSLSVNHTESFAVGQTAAFTIGATNIAPTTGSTAAMPSQLRAAAIKSADSTASGPIAVTAQLSTGGPPFSLSGDGWSCSAGTCTRSDSLPAGSSYPPITATVVLSPDAPYQLTLQSSVSGGGAPTSGAQDTADVDGPLLKVASSDPGNFYAGQIQAAYSVTVFNAGAIATTGAVTLTETLPSGFTLVSMTGTGWLCRGTTCTRSDSLEGGGSYPPITVTVNIDANAASPQVNSAAVTGGGSPNATGTDVASIAPSHGAFFAGEITLSSDGSSYLQLPGNPFGYYSNSFFPWIDHQDLGWVYYWDAQDASGGAYFYDQTSQHIWYTNRATFPYLYDFTLKTWIYYFPDTKNAGHYTTNPRYFVNLTTGVIFTM